MSKGKEAARVKFADAENLAIVAGVRDSYKILSSSFTNTITNQSKNAIWARITTSVNAVSKKIRKRDDVRKKWQDLRNRTKKKEAARKKGIKVTGTVNTIPYGKQRKLLEKMGHTFNTRVIHLIHGSYM